MRILIRSILIIVMAGVGAIAISNVHKVSLAIMIMLNDNDYKRGNYHFSGGVENEFSMWSVKGYQDVVEVFDRYKKTHARDSTLYRNFKPEYWKFWRWYAYTTEPQYALPYRYVTPEEMRITMVRSKYE